MSTLDRIRLRAGDADREETAEALRQALVEGRLTHDEFEQRLDGSLRATYLDELPGLVADLPRRVRAADPDRDVRRRPRGIPVLPLLVLAVVAVISVALVTDGFFPFPLLWLAMLWMFWGHRGRWHGRRLATIAGPRRSA